MLKKKYLLTLCLFIFIGILTGCKSKFEKLQASSNTAKKYQEAMAKINVGNTQQICLREGCGATITSKNPKSLYCSKNQLCINEKQSQNRIRRASKS